MAHAREKRTRKMTYVEMKDVSKYYQWARTLSRQMIKSLSG